MPNMANDFVSIKTDIERIGEALEKHWNGSSDKGKSNECTGNSYHQNIII